MIDFLGDLDPADLRLRMFAVASPAGLRGDVALDRAWPVELCDIDPVLETLLRGVALDPAVLHIDAHCLCLRHCP